MLLAALDARRSTARGVGHSGNGAGGADAGGDDDSDDVECGGVDFGGRRCGVGLGALFV